MSAMTTSNSMMVKALFFVIPAGVEESLTISEIFRDVSTSLDMTNARRLTFAAATLE